MSVVSIGKNFAWMAGLALALLVQTAAAQAEDMTFRLVPIGDPAKCKSRCVDAIAADGEITNSTPDEFVAFLMRTFRDPRVRSVVLLNSPGGQCRRIDAARRGAAQGRSAGDRRACRTGGARGSGVVLTGGGCYSACVYALMGAEKRVIPHGSKVGIHRMFTYEWERDDDSRR